MRLNRSALMAGILAIGAAACGDDVQLVEPTPEPPPPPPPVMATMAPASASVAVGNSVVFAVNASGGVAGDAASWTCASSNTGIATVTSTSVGCSATGVAAGDVTITASVSKSGEVVNVGAQLTVTAEAAPDAGDPAFLIVAGITDSDDDDNTLSGTVTATVNVERGDQNLEELSLLVDGAVVASQSFGSGGMDMGMMPEPEDADAAAEQAVHAFTLSFNSAAYDDHGHPDYLNGEHTISAELEIGIDMADGTHGHETISSNVQTVTFDNDDGYVVTADLGHASALDDDGRRWYGGPLNGHIIISALGVIYSGEETGAVTISLAGCEAEEEEADDGHDHGGEGVSVEFDCEGEDAGRAIAVSEGGQDATILNEDDLPEANIDMEGPAVAPHFSPNPNNREDGWVNLTVDFLGEQGTGSKVDGWLTYNEAEDGEPGVGGYQPVLRYAEDGDIDDALAAAPLSLTNLPGESDADEYCAVVSAADHLGNESDLPDEADDGGVCLTAGTAATYNDDGTVLQAAPDDSYELLLQGLVLANALPDDAAGVTTKADAIEAAQDALADAGLLVGVDITPPGIEIDGAKRIATGDISLSVDVYDDEHEDFNSGLHSLPLLASAERRTTEDTECRNISSNGSLRNTSDDCDDPIALPDVTDMEFLGPAIAYYTVSGTARDKAGNHSAVASHTFVFDRRPPEATIPAVPGAIEAGTPFQVATFLNDDLSIRDYYVTANFAGDIDLGIVGPTVVDAFDADPLTHRNHTVAVDVETYAGITTAPAHGSPATPAAATGVEGVTVAVRDQAQQGATPYTEVSTPGTSLVDAPAAGDNFTVSFSAALEDIDAVCIAEDEDDCAEANRESETELEFEARAGATGAFSEPFERVDFWVEDVIGTSWLIGSDTSGESGRVSSTDRTRTWTYSLEVSADVLYMLTREEGFPRDETGGTTADESTVRAFGVNDDGVALVGSGTVTIDDGDDGT